MTELRDGLADLVQAWRREGYYACPREVEALLVHTTNDDRAKLIEAERDALRDALAEAALSLGAISEAGTSHGSDFLQDIADIRAYATNKASVAREVLMRGGVEGTPRGMRPTREGLGSNEVPNVITPPAAIDADVFISSSVPPDNPKTTITIRQWLVERKYIMPSGETEAEFERKRRLKERKYTTP